MRLPALAAAAALTFSIQAFALPAAAQGGLYVVTHVDVAPAVAADAPPAQMDKARAEAGDHARALLRELASGCTARIGCLRFEVLQQDGAANHFTLVQVWRDRDALDAFEGSALARSVRERLAPNLGSPFDERLHRLAN